MASQIAGDRNRFAQHLFTALPQRYDRLAEVLSMGQNGRWRRAMIDHIVPGLARAACSTWRRARPGVALQLAARTPAHVVGVDLTSGMLAQGQPQRGAGRHEPAGSSWWPAGPSSCPSPTSPSTP